MKNKPSMSSTEVAALIASEGRTTDVDLANQYAAGQLIDPEALEKAFYRRKMGFDFNVDFYPVRHKAIATDLELGLKTTCTWIEDDDEGNARRMAKMCIKLKKMHDSHKTRFDEGETCLQ